MATQEENVLMQKVDKNGNLICAYPVTKAENVANLEDMIKQHACDGTGIPANKSPVQLGQFSTVEEGDVAIGSGTLARGVDCVAIGPTTTAEGERSVAVGSLALTKGERAVALGYIAAAMGDNSIAIGANPGVPGESGIAIGSNASAMGNNGVALGPFSNAPAANSIAIGSKASAGGENSAAIGSNAMLWETNTIQLGSTNLSALRCSVDLTVTSDARDKIVLQDISRGLDFINKLRPIQYVRNPRSKYIDNENLSEAEQEKLQKYGMCEYDKDAHKEGKKAGERKRVGLKAQEIQEALNQVYGSADYANIVNDNYHDLTDVPGDDIENQLTVNYSGLIPFLIDAVQTLSLRVEILENR